MAMVQLFVLTNALHFKALCVNMKTLLMSRQCLLCMSQSSDGFVCAVLLTVDFVDVETPTLFRRTPGVSITAV